VGIGTPQEPVRVTTFKEKRVLWLGWQKQSVEAEGGLFDLLGLKSVGITHRSFPHQFQEQIWVELFAAGRAANNS